MNFDGNLPFSFLESVFPSKALPYSFFPQEGCLSDKEREKNMRGVSKILLTFGVSYLTVLHRKTLKYARLLNRYF